MTLKSIHRSFFPRRDSDTTGPASPGATAHRRGAGRRTVRARHLDLETMEDRLVLSSLPISSLTGMATVVGSPTNPNETVSTPLLGINYTPAPPYSGGNPPGVQEAGDVASATFTIPANSGQIEIGLADYTSATPDSTSSSGATPAVQEMNWLNAQVYYSSSSLIVPNSTSPQTVTLYVNLAHCQPGHEFFQQVDAFYYTSVGAGNNNGGLITNFAASAQNSNPYAYYGNVANITNNKAPENLLGGVVLDCPDAPTGGDGAQSQGFYKNHPDALPSVLEIGNRLYTQAELVALLQANPSGGDATLINVHQLITAYANEANGVVASSTIQAAITASDQLLSTLQQPLIVFDAHGNPIYNTDAAVTNKTNSTLANQLKSLGSTLETFNP